MFFILLAFVSVMFTCSCNSRDAQTSTVSNHVLVIDWNILGNSKAILLIHNKDGSVYAKIYGYTLFINGEKHDLQNVRDLNVYDKIRTMFFNPE